jgi:xanthine dehydrogenase accessory factor
VDLLPTSRQRYVVIATQGQGDMVALNAALASGPSSISFVGSSRKFAALSQKLLDVGADPAAVRSVKAPAGLNINAVTPDEIALSILAELVKQRRAARAEG